jgi:lysozyme
MTLRDALKRDEGFRAYPYLDCCGRRWRECRCPIRGKLTIGYGRNLDDVPLSPEEGGVLLDTDIARATGGVHGMLPWSQALDPARHDALVNIAFNLGISKLLAANPKALAAFERGELTCPGTTPGISPGRRARGSGT